MPGEIYALLGAMLFGVGHLAVRKAHDDGWSNHTVLLTVAIINTVCYTIVVAWLGLTGQLPAVRPEAIGFFALAGLLTTCIGRTTVWASMQYIGASRATSYRMTSPIVTVILAYFLLNERMSVEALLGGVVIIVGLWLLTNETSGSEKTRPLKGQTQKGLLIGVSLGLASSASFGGGQIYRKLGLEFSSAPIIGSLVGSLVSVVMFSGAALRNGRWKEMLDAYRQRFAWPILLAGLLTAAAQFSIFFSYERSRVSTASVLGATEPVWTFLVGSLIMRSQESPTWRLALSIVVIFVGAALVVGKG
jgi:uncharacterized membrane protein